MTKLMIGLLTYLILISLFFGMRITYKIDNEEHVFYMNVDVFDVQYNPTR